MTRILAGALALAHLLIAADPPAPRFLLPGVAEPRRYSLDLTIVPAEATFRGKVAIDIELKQPVSFLWLNGKDLIVDSAGLAAGGQVLKARVAPAGGEFLGFAFPRSVGPGPARLEVRYRGRLSEKSKAGVFRRRSAGGWYVFTTFTAIEARRAFPCFDEPRYKTPWEVTLHVKRGQLAFANSGEVSEEEEPGGMKRVVFAATAPLPSELIAFAVGPFDVVDAGRAGRNRVPVRIITPRGRAADAEAARAPARELLSRIEDYTGIPYPFDKLDHLALINGAFGGVENPGLITYQPQILLVKPAQDSAERRRGLRGTMAHELAHQWFGNLVTMREWEDVWLSEGFATWMSAKLMDDEDAPERRKTLLVSARNRIMTLDARPQARPVRAAFSSREQMRDVYSPLVYQKGGAVLGMLENWLGAEAFRQGIRRYLEAHRFGNAGAADFAAAFGEMSGSVGAMLSGLLDRSGVPLVSVELRCDPLSAARLTLRQERYQPLGSRVAPQTWNLPVCWKGEGLAGGCLALDEREIAIPLPGCPAWVFANAGASGYYRTQLAPELLEAVWRLPAETLTAAEWLTAAQDVDALVLNGRLPAARALALLPRMGKDPDPLIALEAQKLASALAPLVPPPLKARYDDFLRPLFVQLAPAKPAAVELLRQAQQKSVIEFLSHQ